MTGYVLKRHEDGRYVARSGAAHSYTKRLEEAQVFRTRGSAEAGKCGNEYAVPLSQIVGTPI
jgi:hypothetical protein